MSKYIIEIKPEYEDTTKGIMVLGARDSHLYVTTLEVKDLEELNSDYINEHFSDLQDTAYQKGFEDGKKEAESSEVIEQAKVDAFNKGMLYKEEKISEAYQRGLEEGREQMPCDTCAYRHNNLLCADCKWTYGSRYKVDSIGVGDVVKTYNGITYVVTKVTTDGMVVGFKGEGNTCGFALSEVTKTGEHYNINEILGGLCDD